mgnify:CR=1 FL=1
MSFYQYRVSLLPLFVLLAGIVVGCSSTARPQVLAPEYERGASRGASIALLPLSSELVAAEPDTAQAENQDLQAAYFTQEGHKLYYRLFGLELQEVAAAEVIDLSADFRPPSATFQMRTLPVPSGDSLRLPVPDGPVQVGGDPADFLLLIDKLAFTPRSETVRSGNYGSPVRQDNFYITATCQYMLWDNDAARVAAYGTFESETRMVDPHSRTPYEKLFEQLAVHVINASPVPLDARFESTATAP